MSEPVRPAGRDQIRSRLRLLSLDAAPALRAGITPVCHIMEIAELGAALHRMQGAREQN